VRRGLAAFGVVALVSLVALPGCTSDGGGAIGGDASACKPSTAPSVPGKPAVTMPTQRPAKLVTDDLEVGTGPAVTAQSTVTVQFVGVACSTGRQVDSTWDDGRPYTTTLAKGKVIEAWRQGLVGMKQGGRRELVVPPTLGYGDSPPVGFHLAAGETVVYVVDLLKVS
jgi:peptidylprolyl isomerase